MPVLLMGLLFALAASLAAAFTDVLRKRAFTGRELAAAAFWTRAAAALTLAAMLIYRFSTGRITHLRAGGALFSPSPFHLDPLGTFAFYWAINAAILTCGLFLYFRALRDEPLSECVPMLAFTLVFAILVAGFFARLGIGRWNWLGAGAIVVGAFLLPRRSWKMLAAALLLGVSNLLDRQLISMSDGYVTGFAMAVATCWSFFLAAIVRRENLETALKDNKESLALAGAGEGLALILLLSSYAMIAPRLAGGIERAGIGLAPMLGWVFFQEPGAKAKSIGAGIMAVGLLILSLPLR